ncbi:MAG: type II and III secretion system protein family protein [Alphaproteobacteria bacterium]|nr:type II and III secretion system protein family protein [Alphaproteobacteria bacterium]
MIANSGRKTDGQSNIGSLLEAALTAALLVLLLIGLAGHARAAEPGALQIDVHKGTILTLNEPAATIFVADPSIADVESRSQKAVFVYGKKAGETTLFVLNSDDKPIVNVTVRVEHDLTRLDNMIKEVAPDASVSVASVEGGLIVTGKVESPQESEEIQRVAERFLGDKETVLNRLSVTAPTQVNLRVRIAEVSREVLRLLGVTWSAYDATGRTQFNIYTTRPDFTLNAESNTAVIGQRIGPVNLEATIDALEKEGMVSLLAEPNLTAISGETASFLAGGEFPIPVGVDRNTVSIEFKQYGVSLAFTPTVLNSGRISLKLRPEVSQLSDQGAVILSNIQIPGLTTRRAETTIELASGESFVIGGLLQNRTSNDINKVPGLGNLPVLGKLFQSKRYQSEESELVIIATPYLVKPIGSGKKPLAPSDRPVSSHQFERQLIGKLKGAEGSSSTVNGQQLAGPVGFMVE